MTGPMGQSLNYTQYLLKVSEECLPEDIELPGTYLVTWQNGDKSIISAESKIEFFLLLDEAAEPGGVEYKRLHLGCAVHFKKTGYDDEMEEDIFEFEMIDEGNGEEVTGVTTS